MDRDFTRAHCGFALDKLPAQALKGGPNEGSSQGNSLDFMPTFSKVDRERSFLLVYLFVLILFLLSLNVIGANWDESGFNKARYKASLFIKHNS